MYLVILKRNLVILDFQHILSHRISNIGLRCYISYEGDLFDRSWNSIASLIVAEVENFETKFKKRAATSLASLFSWNYVLTFVISYRPRRGVYSVPTDEKVALGTRWRTIKFLVTEIVRNIKDRKHEPPRPAGN